MTIKYMFSTIADSLYRPRKHVWPNQAPAEKPSSWQVTGKSEIYLRGVTTLIKSPLHLYINDLGPFLMTALLRKLAESQRIYKYINNILALGTKCIGRVFCLSWWSFDPFPWKVSSQCSQLYRALMSGWCFLISLWVL